MKKKFNGWIEEGDVYFAVPLGNNEYKIFVFSVKFGFNCLGVVCDFKDTISYSNRDTSAIVEVEDLGNDIYELVSVEEESVIFKNIFIVEQDCVMTHFNGDIEEFVAVGWYIVDSVNDIPEENFRVVFQISVKEALEKVNNNGLDDITAADIAKVLYRIFSDKAYEYNLDYLIADALGVHKEEFIY